MLIKVDSEGPGAGGERIEEGERGQKLRKYQLEGQTITRMAARMMLSGNGKWQKTLQAIMDTLCTDELSSEFLMPSASN